MTVKLIESSLGEVLEIIAAQTGAAIFLHGSLDAEVSLDFTNLSLEEGLRRIAAGKNLFLSYRTDDVSGGQRIWLAEVRIFGSDSKGTMTAFKPGRLMAQSEAANQRKVVAPGRRIDPELDAAAQRLRNATDGVARKQAAEQLGKSWNADAIEPLAQSLSAETDPGVRQAAAEALGNTWNDAAVEPLSQALLQDSSAAVREAAASALGQLWQDRAVPYLVDALMNERDAMVRERVALALGDSAGEEAVDALAQTLANDSRWFVREAAAIALAKLGGGTAQNAILAATVYDSDGWVKQTVTQLELSSRR
jgi:HEAT repeat protein